MGGGGERAGVAHLGQDAGTGPDRDLGHGGQDPREGVGLQQRSDADLSRAPRHLAGRRVDRPGRQATSHPQARATVTATQRGLAAWQRLVEGDAAVTRPGNGSRQPHLRSPACRRTRFDQRPSGAARTGDSTPGKGLRLAPP